MTDPGMHELVRAAGKVLVIKLGAFGDVVLAEGALRDIRRHHPKATITTLTTPGYAAIFERCPHVDVVEIDLRKPPPGSADHVKEEVVVPGGLQELRPHEHLAVVHAGDVQRQPAHHCEAMGAVAFAVARLILVYRLPRTPAPDAAASATSHPRTSAVTLCHPPPPHRPMHPPNPAPPCAATSCPTPTETAPGTGPRTHRGGSESRARNASMSMQVRPPVSIDRRPIINISCRSWRVALLRRGSSTH